MQVAGDGVKGRKECNSREGKRRKCLRWPYQFQARRKIIKEKEIQRYNTDTTIYVTYCKELSKGKQGKEVLKVIM